LPRKTGIALQICSQWKQLTHYNACTWGRAIGFTRSVLF